MFQNKMFKHGNSIDLLGKTISYLIIEWITTTQTNQPNKKTQQVNFVLQDSGLHYMCFMNCRKYFFINKMLPCQYSQGVKQWELVSFHST